MNETSHRERGLPLSCDAIALDEATILSPADDLPTPATAGCALEYFAFSCGRNRGPPSGRLASLCSLEPQRFITNEGEPVSGKRRRLPAVRSPGYYVKRPAASAGI